MEGDDVETKLAYIALLHFGIRPRELVEMDVEEKGLILCWCWYWLKQEKKEREWQAKLHGKGA